MIWLVLHLGVVALLSFLFGVLLQVSDLLQEHGFRWFRGGDVVMGALDTACFVALLLLVQTPTHLLWLAVVLTWVLRGRIDGINHGVMATAGLLTLWFLLPHSSARWPELVYFFGLLAALGLLHDLLQYTEVRAPGWLRWFFANQHLYWYLVALGYQLAFALDVELLCSLYGFVKGYGFFYNIGRRAWLRPLGIRPPASPEASGPAGER